MKQPPKCTVSVTCLAVILAIAFLMSLLATSSCEIKITISAGNQDEFVYSDQEITSSRGTITVSASEECGDALVLLLPVEYEWEAAYEPFYITPGMPVEIEVEPGAWYKLGISRQNPTAEVQYETLIVEGALELRIP